MVLLTERVCRTKEISGSIRRSRTGTPFHRRLDSSVSEDRHVATRDRNILLKAPTRECTPKRWR